MRKGNVTSINKQSNNKIVFPDIKQTLSPMGNHQNFSLPPQGQQKAQNRSRMFMGDGMNESFGFKSRNTLFEQSRSSDVEWSSY